MPGVPRRLIEHSLNVDPKATPKRQHLRCFADERRDTIKKELVADFIREVFDPKWLTNPVLVRKKNMNEWRMCVNYTNLNKHCPKDPKEVMTIDVDWRQPFIDYIREQKVPTDKNLAEQIIRRAKSYLVVGDKLYRRGATSRVLMKCVP
jgi:predicted TIM-barrel fold metal-dependent hydrolase